MKNIINKEINELKRILNNIDNKELKVFNLLCRESKKALRKTKFYFVEMVVVLQMRNI